VDNLKIIIILLFSLNMGFGQLTLEKEVFPEVGDSIIMLRDLASSNYNLLAGENRVWDFKQLETPLYSTITFKTSDFYERNDQAGRVFMMDNGQLSFLYITSQKGLEEIGFLLKIGDENKRSFPVYYDKSIIISSSSLSFGEKIYNRVKFDFEIEKKDLPLSLQKELPKSIKNIRISGIKSLHRNCDAWGKLFLPDNNFLTNRIKVTEHYEIRLYDTKSGKAIPYFDDEMKFELLPVKQNSSSYEFYSNKLNYIAAKVNLNQDGSISSIDYQSRDPRAQGVNLESRFSDFVLYPNPTFNLAKVFISNHEAGSYSLAVYNIIGKKLWQRTITVDGQSIIKENFGFLPKGTYLISLLDKNGNILRTTRLVIISV